MCVHQGIIFNDVYKLGKLKFTNLVVVILCLQCHKQVCCSGVFCYLV